MNRQPRHFYAIVYAYGRNVENNGNRPDVIHRFASVGERTAFLAHYNMGGMEADAVRKSHPDVQKANRYAALGLPWPIDV